MTTKQCSKCRSVLPLDGFYGQAAACKECTKQAVRANYRKNREHYRAYERERFQQPERRAYVYARTPLYLDKRGDYVRRSNNKHPERRAARAAVGNAIRAGRLERQPCAVCGAQAEAHHDDYSKPLEVVWLCKKHHGELHRYEHERNSTTA